MSSYEADRLHASDVVRREEAVRLARSFELFLRGASPATANLLAAAPAASTSAAGTIIAAIIEIADRVTNGAAVSAFDALRQNGCATPRHDAVVGHALIAALKDVLGPAFDEATREAWADGYIRTVEIVMAARRNRMDFVA